MDLKDGKDDAIWEFPFKGVGDSREKIRFRLVKDYQATP